MIVQTQTTSFKRELYEGVHNFFVDNFKIALYQDGAVLNADTAVYTPAGEIATPGYAAGGMLMTGVGVDSGAGVAWVTFANVSWPVGLTAAGALIYNTSKGNKSVAVLDFGGSKTTATQFTIVMPPPGAQTALIRSA